MRLRIAFLVLCVIAGFLALIKAAGGQDNCTEFGFQISTSCCCSNGCCRETEPGEVVHIKGDLYQVTPSGQMIYRTGWSPDGRFIRCACDQIEGKWTVHPKAQTRCIYPPMPSS